MNMKGLHRWKPASVAMLVLLAACGGSGPDDTLGAAPQTSAAVTVIGDSLADVGVFGVRYTIQSGAAQAPFPLWPELVADELQAPRPCRAYQASSETDFTPQQACRGYAVAGGRVQHPQQQTPLSIGVQLRDAAARAGSNGFGAHEVLLGTDKTQELLLRPGGWEAAGHAYMAALDPAELPPEYDIAQCTADWLDANAPAGGAPAAGWWKTYAFADGLHPTPRGHELMAQAVVKVLAAKGWK